MVFNIYKVFSIKIGFLSLLSIQVSDGTKTKLMRGFYSSGGKVCGPQVCHAPMRSEERKSSGRKTSDANCYPIKFSINSPER